MDEKKMDLGIWNGWLWSLYYTFCTSSLHHTWSRKTNEKRITICTCLYCPSIVKVFLCPSTICTIQHINRTSINWWFIALVGIGFFLNTWCSFIPTFEEKNLNTYHLCLFHVVLYWVCFWSVTLQNCTSALFI